MVADSIRILFEKHSFFSVTFNLANLYVKRDYGDKSLCGFRLAVLDVGLAPSRKSFKPSLHSERSFIFPLQTCSMLPITYVNININIYASSGCLKFITVTTPCPQCTYFTTNNQHFLSWQVIIPVRATKTTEHRQVQIDRSRGRGNWGSTTILSVLTI